MYKGIEWLKEEIGDLPITDTVFISDGVSYIDSAVSVMAVYDLIDKLDEPEVTLNRAFDKKIEWLVQMINEELDILRQRLESGKGTPNQNAFDDGRGWALVHVLRMMYYPDKLEELSKKLPVIPQFVADWIEKAKEKNYPLAYAINQSKGELGKWLHSWGTEENQDLFAEAWLDGYEVEEEPLYHALIKGHEVSNFHDIYWNYDKSDDGVFVSRLHPPHDNFLNEMSKEDWNKLGINDSNADFVKVKE